MKTALSIVAGVLCGMVLWAAVAYASGNIQPQVQSFVIDGKHCILAVVPGSKWAPASIAMDCTWVAGAVPVQELEVKVPSHVPQALVIR